MNYVVSKRFVKNKEDDILYPLAERVIPKGMRVGILQGYQAAESLVFPEFRERYQSLVTLYEQGYVDRL